MWYPVSDVATSEPVTLAEAEDQIFADEGDFSASIDMLISSARAHVEAYCNRVFANHTMVWACDGFADFSRVPAAPALDITSILYVDEGGVSQTMPPSDYALRPDGLEPWIEVADGVEWPKRQPGSRITVSGTFGGTCPPEVKHAMLLLIGDGFTTRENVARPVWTAVDALLSNHRRGAW